MPRGKRVCFCNVCKGKLQPIDSRKVHTHTQLYGTFQHRDTTDFLERNMEIPEFECLSEESVIHDALDDPSSESDSCDEVKNSGTFKRKIISNLEDETSKWPRCICNNCRAMPTLKESKCCQTTNIVDGKIESEGLTCITEQEGFIVNCLNRYVLETSYYDYRIQNGPLEENQLVHEVYRYIAYRRFTRWVYGLLGKRHRKVIPSCAVIKIREAFPSQEYCGFKYPE